MLFRSKMSKSVGNVKSINHVLETWGPNVARLFCLSGHYSKPIDYTEGLLKENLVKLRQIETCYYELRLAEGFDSTEGISTLLTESREKFDAALNDDFNTPKALARLFEMVPKINSLKEGKIKMEQVGAAALEDLKACFHAFIFDIFGLEDQVEAGSSTGAKALGGVMELVIDMRKQARADKDWATSDKIRDSLKEAGVQIKDSKEGAEWELI